MNKILVVFFFSICFSSYSQKKAEVKDFFWGKSDSVKSVLKTPEKWKDESAVIIYKYEYYDYHNSGAKVEYISAYRQRIKLQDEASIKEFSEFSFKDKFHTTRGYKYKEGTTFLGVKIVKPNGDEIEVDVDKNAKKVDEEKKIAINSLEIGDIIDYYYYSYEPFVTLYQNFDPVENTLGDVYPIMKRKMQFLVEDDFYVDFNTYNGAPDLKELPAPKKHTKQYELVATDIERNDFPRWFYPLVEMPCYKFQVYFTKSDSYLKSSYFNYCNIFVPKKGTNFRKTVNEDDIFDHYEKRFAAIHDLGATLKFLKGKTFENDEEKIKTIYEFARHQYFTHYIETAVIGEAKIFDANDLFKTTIFYNKQYFLNYFMAIMKEFKINYSIILATSRADGPLEDLLIENNLVTLFRINTPKPFFIENITPFSEPGVIDYDLENTKAYSMDFVNNNAIANVTKFDMPTTTAKDNVTQVITNVSLDADMANLNIKRSSSFFGHFKSDEQSRKLKFYDYVDEDYAKYGTERILDKVGNKKKHDQYSKEFEAVKNKLKDVQKEDEKKAISGEFDFEVEDAVITIKNTGRYGENTPFSYDEEFVLKNNFIKKAGPNYIVEIGKMLTNQVEIDKKEAGRKSNVYMPFPRTFDNEIIFEIPAGYKASGIEKFNKKVQNATGEFTSTAVIKDNKLIIKTIKTYNNYYEPNANWSKITAFLEAAYQFTQEKILLKKG